MTPVQPRIVVVGGGHAGAALCQALASAGLGPRVHLVCAEPELPYQRPPLSKAYLREPAAAVQPLRSAAWFAESGITVHLGNSATAIDRAARRLHLRSGRALPYDWLVLATGTRARALPGLPAALDNVALLRTAAQAERLRGLLHAAPSVTILGAGFIGLEVAATARALGKPTLVVDSAPRPMARSVSAPLAEAVLAMHRAAGIEVRLGTRVDGFELQGERLAALRLDGQRHAVDLLLAGIGAQPETGLAAAAGLACDDGIVVDACMRSDDPAILAIGDAASFPAAEDGARRRLESVQNANDQAATALRTIMDEPQPYRALPWFWSDQGGARLQMVGLLPAVAQCHRRPGRDTDSFSLLHYEGARLACVESFNAPADHLAARRLLAEGLSPAPALACDPALPLRQCLAAAV